METALVLIAVRHYIILCDTEVCFVTEKDTAGGYKLFQNMPTTAALHNRYQTCGYSSGGGKQHTAQGTAADNKLRPLCSDCQCHQQSRHATTAIATV